MENYDEFYYPNVCHVCKSKDAPLKTCRACGAYRYCSAEHQKVHWPVHRRVCRILAGLSRGSDGDWLRARIGVKIALERGLGRRLTTSENQLWMFPRACLACHETDRERLFDCPRCPAVSYCSREHERAGDHARLCEEMRRQFAYYCGLLRGTPVDSLDPSAPFSRVASEVFDDARFDKEDAEFSIVRRSEKLSHVSTIFNALNLSRNILRNNISEENLKIHIVGAVHEYEFLDRRICELLFHWMSDLKSIQVTFVGPELKVYDDSDGRPLCSACRRRGASVRYRFERVLYSEYVSTDDHEAPDVIAVFNCGFDEFAGSDGDTWGGSLPLLCLPGVPLLVTSYTQREAELDFERLEKSLASERPFQVLARCEPNEFRSRLPLRDWTDPRETYYSNNFYSVILKQY